LASFSSTGLFCQFISPSVSGGTQTLALKITSLVYFNKIITVEFITEIDFQNTQTLQQN
jgi:hypothetical protein